MNIEEQLKQILKIPVIEERYLELIKLLNKDRDRLMEQNKRYKLALEFYANKKNYDIKHLSEDEHEIPVFKDYGEKARNALEEEI